MLIVLVYYFCLFSVFDFPFISIIGRSFFILAVQFFGERLCFCDKYIHLCSSLVNWDLAEALLIALLYCLFRQAFSVTSSQFSLGCFRTYMLPLLTLTGFCPVRTTKSGNNTVLATHTGRLFLSPARHLGSLPGPTCLQCCDRLVYTCLV